MADQMRKENFLKELEKTGGAEYKLGKVIITREKNGREIIDRIIMEKGRTLINVDNKI